jgi:glycosyltransferase involved in cell wall biosynthesis/ribosomal protein S18 acetylase RimI-like enzyme
VGALKSIVKRLWFGMLGKDPEGVVLVAHSGDPARGEALERLMRELVPDRRIFVVHDEGGSAGALWLHLRRCYAPYRIALCAVLFDGDPRGRALRRALCVLAPRRILAFNANLERHHLSLASPLASLLFLFGVPLDRIFLRPRWLAPWKSDRSVLPTQWHHAGGRGFREGFPRVGIVSPYLPWPPAHGGAVRLWNLLAHAADSYDIVYFGFEDGQKGPEIDRAATLCARLYVAAKPRYREPRWASLAPSEVREFHNRPLERHLRALLARHEVPLLQAEYTQMAAYSPDILVEHDVTQDLLRQVHARQRSLRSRWEWARWVRFENAAVARASRVIVMSEKDRALLPGVRTEVIANGVDLDRFQPSPESAGARLLFIGSFRHFPNVAAYRYLVERIWPKIAARHPEATLRIVAGPNPDYYWREDAPDPRIERLGFVADVKPLYDEANLAIIPTLESAGTNLKALEAMAMARAIVSTPSGVAGLGLVHGDSVWIAADEDEFAEGVLRLLADAELRGRLAASARQLAESRYGWPALAARQVEVWDELHPGAPRLRPMELRDVTSVGEIQMLNHHESAHWDPREYLDHDTWVAECEGEVAAYLAMRQPVPDEAEVLNIAVHPRWKRRGLATRLLARKAAIPGRTVYLEVRASNVPALNLYKKLGFQPCAVRPDYYTCPKESGIVMRLQR